MKWIMRILFVANRFIVWNKFSGALASFILQICSVAQNFVAMKYWENKFFNTRNKFNFENHENRGIEELELGIRFRFVLLTPKALYDDDKFLDNLIL